MVIALPFPFVLQNHHANFFPNTRHILIWRLYFFCMILVGIKELELKCDSNLTKKNGNSAISPNDYQFSPKIDVRIWDIKINTAYALLFLYFKSVCSVFLVFEFFWFKLSKKCYYVVHTHPCDLIRLCFQFNLITSIFL